MSLAAFSKRDLHTIGKILVRQQPKVAEELLSLQRQQLPPLDSDLCNIPLYFIQFCSLNNLDASAIAVSNRENFVVSNKRKFIGCMLAIYAPWTLTQQAGTLNLKHGFVRKVAGTLSHSENNISEKIREVIIHYQRYDDFRGPVDATVGKMKGGSHGS